MNHIPMYVLVDCVTALTEAHASLRDTGSVAAYLKVLSAKQQLELAMSKLAPVQVEEA